MYRCLITNLLAVFAKGVRESERLNQGESVMSVVIPYAMHFEWLIEHVYGTYFKHNPGMS